MDRLKQKYAQLIKAIKTLNVSLCVLDQLTKHGVCCDKRLDYDEEYRIHRDSVIQRFEYCVDFLWKYLKVYLESRHIAPDTPIASEIVRQACATKVINEQESERILAMIKSRNMTSHMYVEEIAQQLVGDIPRYYELMHGLAERLVPPT
jgi:nucleotidyltransferase substrate binding protein (TIGR01987 family)